MANPTKTSPESHRIARYWSSNRCTMGDACNFAHSDRELREQPDLAPRLLVLGEVFPVGFLRVFYLFFQREV